MRTLIENFPKQLAEAMQIGAAAKLSAHSKKIRNVYIAGLGGSGIGGSIVSELASDESLVPVTVGKGYFIPGFVSDETLFIASSYSGNTEETLACLEQAIRRKAKIVCITSGGKVAEIAKEHQLDLILVPGGMPPRSCLGYSLTQLLFVLEHNSIIRGGFRGQLESAIELIGSEKESILSEAKEVAARLKGKTPVIYCTTNNEGIAIRFRQQLNENSKILCWHQVIPEMNHNELVGWTEKHDELHVIIFRDRDEYERNNTRIEINKKVISKYAPVTEIWSKGRSAIEKAVYLIHLGDWISLFLAEARGVDAVEVNVINHLKSELAKT
ncbi:MAG: bifunctional phosphoglucose/phosphomannose isomerase [Bacteroidota bacterium]